MKDYYNQFSETEAEILDKEVDVDFLELIVHNDDFNTFEFVIECFVRILKHSMEQAEQLSYIIHFSGKASVKVGTFPELKPCKDALVSLGLSATIE